MIFVKSERGGALFVMLTEQDINNMRAGHTTFVDQRQLKGETFLQVILSLHKNNEAALQMLRDSGHAVPQLEQLEPPQPKPDQLRCAGCDGIKAFSEMHEGKCILCWANQATLYRDLLKAEKGER